MIRALFHAYWRALLPALMTVIFFGLLAIAGLIFLHENGWLLWFLGLMTLAACLVWAIQWIPDFRKQPSPDELNQPAVAWNPTEKAAMGDVLKLAEKTSENPPRNLDDARSLGETLIRIVAVRLHPGREFATAQFTIPDLLVAVEVGVRSLRTSVIHKVPGSDVIKVSDLQLLLGYYDRYGSLVRALYLAYRVFRLATNPVKGILQEASGLLQGEALNSGWAQVKGRIWRNLVEEAGRLCIDLYGGRLKAPIEELEREWRTRLPDPVTPLPVRVLVVGQVNAGKSSLVNAMLGDTQCEVSVVPSTKQAREFRVRSEDGPEVIVVDTPGLDDSASSLETLKEEASKSDIIVWVSAAANPARDTDLKALRVLETHFTENPKLIHPPLLGVATQIDRLPPRREWNPPYNIEFPNTDKATSIRDALKHLRSDFAPHIGVVVPICLRNDGGSTKPYNIEAIWVTLALMVPDGRRAALRRMLDSRPGFSLSKAAWQVWQSGRFVGKSVLESQLDRLR